MAEAVETNPLLRIIDLTTGEWLMNSYFAPSANIFNSPAALQDTIPHRFGPQYGVDTSKRHVPSTYWPDLNVAPQSPPEGSDDGTFRSDDRRPSVTSEDLSSETSSSEDDAAQANGPVLNNPLADKPLMETRESDNASDANSHVSSDSGSTNSWVNEDDEILTTTDLLDPYDWETEPLPELTESQWKEYNFLKGKSMMPLRDDGIYRCLECAWEVEYGYCLHCQICYDGIAPPDCEWRSSTRSEYFLKSSEVAKDAPKELSELPQDATQDPEGQVDQVGNPENPEINSGSLDSSENEKEKIGLKTPYTLYSKNPITHGDFQTLIRQQIYAASTWL